MTIPPGRVEDDREARPRARAAPAARRRSSWTATADGPRAAGLPRIMGHRRGIQSVRAVVEEGCRLGLDQLTLYCLSVENWKRPPRELTFLMRLLRHFLVVERARADGAERPPDDDRPPRGAARRRARPSSTGRSRLTAGNTGMTLCLAVNYGGRTEIADAARRLAEDVRAGRLDPDQVDEVALRVATSTRPGCPTPTS